MKKNILLPAIFITLICLTGLYSCTYGEFFNCYGDLNRAYEISGVAFPITAPNYFVRAKSGMVEISYPLDEQRYVFLRKTTDFKGHDISGIETEYPVERDSYLSNGMTMSIKEDDEKIYVVNFATSAGYYSIYCAQGLDRAEVDAIYNLIAQSETAGHPNPIPSTL